MVSKALSDERSRSVALMKRRRFAQAADAFRQSIARQPSAESQAGLASALLEMGELREALQHSDTAIGVNAQLAVAHAIRGRVNVALGAYSAAVTDFGRSARLRRSSRLSSSDNYVVPAHYLSHTLEQLEYLEACGLASSRLRLRMSARERSQLRRQLSAALKQGSESVPDVQVRGADAALLSVPPYFAPREPKLACVNVQHDYSKLEKEFLSGSARYVIVDNFLEMEALASLRHFCLGATVWRRPYRQGYVGAFPDDGFACRTIFGIADQLKVLLPRLLGQHRLCQWWGFVYDAQLQGIDVHADEADISVNFWITPDEANLDPESGGLEIWNRRAPRKWSFDRYNSGGDRTREYLESVRAVPTNIGHRENRAIIFDGKLFHQTAAMRFASGYESRRRNITLLFRREKPNTG